MFQLIAKYQVVHATQYFGSFQHQLNALKAIKLHLFPFLTKKAVHNINLYYFVLELNIGDWC